MVTPTEKPKTKRSELVASEETRERIKKEFFLNNGQASAYMLMMGMTYRKDKEMFVLKGYAGTGKTYVINVLLKNLMEAEPYSMIAITAPTNKAVKVLYDNRRVTSDRIYYKTVHGLFGLSEVIDAKGNITYKPTPNSKGSALPNSVNYIIVDEASMLSDELFWLLDSIKKPVKIIFMGDPAQIPPVNASDSIPFRYGLSKRHEEGYTLTQIMRQKDENPIVELTLKMRESLTEPFPIKNFQTKLNSKDEGIVLVKNVEDLLENFKLYFDSDEFRANADYAKVIAWTNLKVKIANDEIRKILYGQNAPKIVVGEKLLANSPIESLMPTSRGGKSFYAIVFSTSDEMEVESYQIKSIKIGSEAGFKRKYLPVHYLKVYECKVAYMDEGILRYRTIRILHEDSQQEFEKNLDAIKQQILAKKPGVNWLDYYSYKRRFADVGYNYAITAHKSQGSTYVNTFVIEDDINLNNRIVERNRIKYTAYSRASKKLFIYKKEKP